jgi:RNA polymerase sigma-54 factor
MSGALKSAQSVKEMIKEIIANNKDEKISDQKITEILLNSGIKIARRTVSKYRKNLKILPSHQRKF